MKGEIRVGEALAMRICSHREKWGKKSTGERRNANPPPIWSRAYRLSSKSIDVRFAKGYDSKNPTREKAKLVKGRKKKGIEPKVSDLRQRGM